MRASPKPTGFNIDCAGGGGKVGGWPGVAIDEIGGGKVGGWGWLLTKEVFPLSRGVYMDLGWKISNLQKNMSR